MDATGRVLPNPTIGSTGSAAKTEAPDSGHPSWMKAKNTTEDMFIRLSKELKGFVPGAHRSPELNSRVEFYDMGEALIQLLGEAEEALEKFQKPVSATIEEVVVKNETSATIEEDSGGDFLSGEIHLKKQGGTDVRVHVKAEDEAEDEVLEGSVAADDGLAGRAKAAPDLKNLGDELRTPLEEARDKREFRLRLYSIGLIALGILVVGVGLAIMFAGAATMNPAAAVGLGVLGMFIAGAASTYVGYKFGEHMHTFHGETSKHEALGKEDESMKNKNEEIERINRMDQKLAKPETKTEILSRVDFLNSKKYEINKGNYSNFVKGYEEFENTLDEIRKNGTNTANEMAKKRSDLNQADAEQARLQEELDELNQMNGGDQLNKEAVRERLDKVVADQAKLKEELDALTQKSQDIQTSKTIDRLNVLLEQKMQAAGVHPIGSAPVGGQGQGGVGP